MCNFCTVSVYCRPLDLSSTSPFELLSHIHGIQFLYSQSRSTTVSGSNVCLQGYAWRSCCLCFQKSLKSIRTISIYCPSARVVLACTSLHAINIICPSGCDWPWDTASPTRKTLPPFAGSNGRYSSEYLHANNGSWSAEWQFQPFFCHLYYARSLWSAFNSGHEARGILPSLASMIKFECIG